MTDQSTGTDGDTDGPERPGHPSVDRQAEGSPAPDSGSERYGPTASEDDVPEESEPLTEGFFDRVPEWVVPLGAGSLATSTLLTLAVMTFVYYAVATSQWFGYEPYQLVLAALQFTFAAGLQVSGVYFARKQERWLWVMLAALSGVLSIVGLPFAILAVVCLGLGKNHFAAHTPLQQIRAKMDS